MADTLLSVNNLHVSYGAIKAVRGISFEIKIVARARRISSLRWAP